MELQHLAEVSRNEAIVFGHRLRVAEIAARLDAERSDAQVEEEWIRSIIRQGRRTGRLPKTESSLRQRRLSDAERDAILDTWSSTLQSTAEIARARSLSKGCVSRVIDNGRRDGDPRAMTALERDLALRPPPPPPPPRWPVPNSPVTSRRLRRGTVSDWQMEGRFCPNCPLQ